MVCAGGSACRKPAAPAAPAASPLAQVVAVGARVQPVTENLSLVGTLALNEQVEIKSEIESVIQQLNLDEGQRVEKGAHLSFLQRGGKDRTN